MLNAGPWFEGVRAVSEPEENYLARAFRDVDAGANRKVAHCLRCLEALPSFRSYKHQMLEAMNPQPGQVTADLGCGLGFDVLRLASRVGPNGRALGVDASVAFLEEVRLTTHHSAAVEWTHADIQQLPFPEGSLHSCQVDRTP